MKEYLDDSKADYRVNFLNKEYVFSINRAGVGYCDCRTDALKAIQREDRNMGIKAIILGDQKARNRMLGLEEEFSVDVKLPKRLAKMIWEGWDEVDLDDGKTCEATPERLAKQKALDEALFPIVEKCFFK
jgi:hypothetical protein